MRVIEDEAYRAYLRTPEDGGWAGTRVEDVREQELRPGGRVVLTMFARVGTGRSHPRMQVDMPPAQDPSPPGTLFAPRARPSSVAELRAQIRQALDTHRRILSVADLDAARAPKGSQQYWKNSIRVQRVARFFAQVRKSLDSWLAAGALPRSARNEALFAVRQMEDEAYAVDLRFDNHTIGTYYSYLRDEPFVHYMEMLLASLPEEGTEGFALLPAEARYSIRRQREQLRNHLDFIMRYKYAYRVVEETDIERSVGGLLIDRDSRRIVSEVPADASLAPRHELLRIAPDAAHDRAGDWVYRDAKGAIYLQDGARVEVEEGMLRAVPLSSRRLTFRRAPGSAQLRAGMRLDWDGTGYVQGRRIAWVSWAGHCDVQAVIEGLGLVLSDGQRLEEYRSDVDATTVYDRRLLLEMIASIIELGSVYRRMDGSGALRRGRRHFGGARNDGLPDRLQLHGLGAGQHFRWPIAGRQDELRVTKLEFADAAGNLEQAKLGTVFYQNLPDLDALDFAPNPRYRGTVEGDYSIIDASGARIEAEIMVDSFDETTGYPVEEKRSTVIDLRPQPEPGPEGMRFFLGTHLEDPVQRRLYRVYLDRDKNRIVAALDQYEQKDGKWAPRTVDEESFVLPLARPLRCTLSREVRRNHPEVYQTLLDIAFRKGQNIGADTSKDAPVWNGMVTRMVMRKLGENPAARVERWRVDVEARFGRAKLDYLMRRNELGEPVEYCPAEDDDSPASWVDFFWQEFPDVGSKGYEDGAWIVNETMLDRHLVQTLREPSASGGVRVHDDHVRNVYEMIFTALAGYPYSIVHANERYGFRDRAAWQSAVTLLKRRRARLRFTAP